MSEPVAVVWALSALALGEITVLAAFALITLLFTIICVPLMFFARSLYKVILGWHI